MRQRQNLDLLLTGFWLGEAQVGLGFHLIYSQGAGVVYYFALLAVWLFGSILGMRLINSARTAFFVQIFSALAFPTAALMSRSMPFTILSLLSILTAVLAISSYAGWFLKSRIAVYNDVSRVLLYENNGFILGYAFAGMLLFFSISKIDFSTLFLLVFSIIFELVCPLKYPITASEK
ncbi:MAG: hypothetical protein K8F91_24940 [Candidatus Obscuribacterales bacterium]|nr:hypothetical protein [Candidatus Obscuribacterales bacterium]